MSDFLDTQQYFTSKLNQDEVNNLNIPYFQFKMPINIDIVPVFIMQSSLGETISK